MDIIGIYLLDQNMGMAFVKARCTHIQLVLIFLGEMQLSVLKSRSALSPLASCWTSHLILRKRNLFDFPPPPKHANTKSVSGG